MAFICLSMYHFGVDLNAPCSGAVMFGISTLHEEIWYSVLRYLHVRHARRLIYAARSLALCAMFFTPPLALLISSVVGLAGPKAIFYWACCVHAPMTLGDVPIYLVSLVTALVYTCVAHAAHTVHTAHAAHAHAAIAVACTHILWRLPPYEPFRVH